MPANSNRKRSYNSPQRDEQANATRRAILAAAATLFEQRGFAATTMQAIADAAEVSAATLYLYFPGRAAIVRALAEEITAAPDLSVEQFEHENDTSAQLRMGAAIIRRLNERSWLVADIVRNAHATDPALAQVWTEWQERHLHAMQRSVAALEANASLRSGLSADLAVDVLYALTGTDLYRTLVRERGWTPEQYEGWLLDTMGREILGSHGE